MPPRLYQKLLNASKTAGLASRWFFRSTLDGTPSVSVAQDGAPLLYARFTPSRTDVGRVGVLVHVDDHVDSERPGPVHDLRDSREIDLTEPLAVRLQQAP